MEDIVVRAMCKDDVETGSVETAKTRFSKELQRKMIGLAWPVSNLVNVLVLKNSLPRRTSTL